MIESCKICPRKCVIENEIHKAGFCNAEDEVKIGRVMLHQWEEPFISGANGSGAIFFSNCNLKCVYCQNHEISQGLVGKEVRVARLSEIMLEQQERGAHNINLVTPTHYVKQIIIAIKAAKEKGLVIPIIYNSNAYETQSTIDSLAGLIDVYLPDIKYFQDLYAVRYSNAPKYFRHASSAVERMFSQVGSVVLDNQGLITRGVVIRHLVLPGLYSDSKKILAYVASKFGNSVYFCLMNQYTPVYKSSDYPEINKRIDPEEYEGLIEYCFSLGLDNVLIQESSSASKEFIPDFNLNGV